MPEREVNQSRLAVGLMSGTSLDGVDAALVRISGPAEKPAVRLLSFVSVPYPLALRQRLLKVAGGAACGAAEISRLNFALGEAFAATALRVCRQGRVSPQRLAFIGSHGQTVFHQGPSRSSRGGALPQGAGTLQIGEPAIIAARTGVTVVADFRPADLAAGGQGAPLVPLVDYLLLRHARYGTVTLNIGGVANVTVIPARAKPAEVFGFDTGPGNMVIDGLMRHFTSGQKTYDAGGRLATEGRVIEPLVAETLGLPFFRRRPPKSAGREQFGQDFLARHFLRRRSADSKDLMRSATELTARSIVDALKRFVFPRADIHRLVVSGGGAHNRFLLSRLVELLPHLSVQLSDDYGLPVDAKEAMAFAALADRTLHGLPGNLPPVTGARRAVVLGKIVQPSGSM